MTQERREIYEAIRNMIKSTLEEIDKEIDLMKNPLDRGIMRDTKKL